MHVPRFLLRSFAFLSLLAIGAIPSTASAESYQEYLSRLRDICSAECLEPRALQRTARKRDAGDDGDMAVIMDVAEVRRNGDKFELLSLDLSRSPLEDLAILGSAGVNTSSSNGVGGLPRGRDGGTSPDLIIIEIDEATLFDILNISAAAVPSISADTSGAAAEGVGQNSTEGGIVVEGDTTREMREPGLPQLRSYFRNRRVVVRGRPRLRPVIIGARRDFRRKQVTLELVDADNLVMLPRYDSDGNPILSETGEY